MSNHPDADRLTNPRQKFACQAKPDETHYVIWHSDCDECMNHLRRVMELPGYFFMTHGASYWCDTCQDTHRHVGHSDGGSYD
jgi:hypothetical protein